MVCNDRLCDSSSDGIDLSCHSSSLHPDANIQIGEFVLAQDQNRLENLKTKRFRLNVLDRLTIDLDKATPLLGKRTCCGGLLSEGGIRMSEIL